MSGGDHLETSALTRIEQARHLRIATEEEYASAGDFLHALKALRKEIDDTHDPAIRAAHAAHKAAIAAKEKHAGIVRDAERMVKNELARFLAERERHRRQHEARLVDAATEEAERRRAGEAKALLAAGEAERARAVLDAPLAVPAVCVPAAVPRLQGIVSMRRWRAEVTDLLLLVEAVARRAVPLEALRAHQGFLNEQAQQMKANLGYPGVKAVEGAYVAVRG